MAVWCYNVAMLLGDRKSIVNRLTFTVVVQYFIVVDELCIVLKQVNAR